MTAVPPSPLIRQIYSSPDSYSHIAFTSSSGAFNLTSSHILSVITQISSLPVQFSVCPVSWCFGAAYILSTM